jgi:hypothetical protein
MAKIVRKDGTCAPRDHSKQRPRLALVCAVDTALHTAAAGPSSSAHSRQDGTTSKIKLPRGPTDEIRLRRHSRSGSQFL